MFIVAEQLPAGPKPIGVALPDEDSLRTVLAGRGYADGRYVVLACEVLAEFDGVQGARETAQRIPTLTSQETTACPT